MVAVSLIGHHIASHYTGMGLLRGRKQGQGQQRPGEAQPQPADEAAQAQVVLQRLHDLAQLHKGDYEERAGHCADQPQRHGEQQIAEATKGLTFEILSTNLLKEKEDELRAAFGAE